MFLTNAYAGQNRRVRLTTAGAAGAVAVAAVLGTGVATSVGATVHSHRATVAAAKASGDVDVLSAGSLDTLMTKKVAPAFHAATGYTLVDTSGGSKSLAADIKNKVDVADVFISASPKVTQTLMGKKNGGWIDWYAEFADSPYVLAYYPKSTFAKDLKTMPWYKVISKSGFRLGRTDPSQDPGGALAVTALDEAAAKFKVPALKKLATETSDEYQEDTEEADIQSGQLDASFMYEADANSQDSPFVTLSGVPTLYGDYTISLVKGGAHRTAALAFVKFMLSAKGQSLLKQQKFGIVSPVKVSGYDVPPTLKSVFK